MEDDGLFDQSRMEDEPFDALPPPLSPGQDQGDPFGDDENGETSKLADVPEAKRKGVKRPQPKLDSNRLISDRGLPALRTLFTNVQFKGRGHEAEDLRLLMKKMENWAHRLFPKLQFEDFIDKVERLGAKKEVQTCLKRIRLDMPLTHEDYTSQEGEEQAPDDMQIFGDPDPFAGEHLSASPPRPVHSTPAPGGPGAHSQETSLGWSPAPSAPSLSEEQRRRMEENRLKALEKRLAKQKRLREESQSVQSQSTQSQPPESQTGTPEPAESQTGTPEPAESQTGTPEPAESQTGTPEPAESQTGTPEPPESQTKEPELAESQFGNPNLVPMEESTEVTSEPAPSPSRVQDQIHEALNPVSSSMTPNQDSENHVEPTPEPGKPEASPSPVPEPEESREDEE